MNPLIRCEYCAFNIAHKSDCIICSRVFRAEMRTLYGEDNKETSFKSIKKLSETREHSLNSCLHLSENVIARAQNSINTVNDVATCRPANLRAFVLWIFFFLPLVPHRTVLSGKWHCHHGFKEARHHVPRLTMFSVVVSFSCRPFGYVKVVCVYRHTGCL